MKFTEDLKKRLIEEGFDAHFVKHIMDDFEDIPIHEFSNLSFNQLDDFVEQSINRLNEDITKLFEVDLEDKMKIVESIQLHQNENIKSINKKVKPADMLKGVGVEPKTLEKLGVKTIADVRDINTEKLLLKSEAKESGLNEKIIIRLKERANLSAVAGEKELFNALVEIGADSLRKLALTPMDKIERDIDAAIEERRLPKENRPDKNIIIRARKDAQQLYNALLDIKIPNMTKPIFDPCRKSGEDCCSDPLYLSPLSKPAYINYMARKCHTDLETLSHRFFQNFATADCEEVPLVRLGIEVLEKALLAEEFEDVDPKKLYRLILADRTLVWQALLSRTERLSPEKRKESTDRFAPNPFKVIGVLDSIESLKKAVIKSSEHIIKLYAWLQDRQNSNLSRDIIESAWLRASRFEFERAGNELGDGWENELRVLGRINENNFTIVESARLYRQALIDLTGKSASKLRAQYHVDFQAQQGSLERCEQAILTLQESLSCNHPQYHAYCDTDKTDIIEPFYKDYESYKLWIEQHLYPENFYDLHLKSPMVRGDVPALRIQLTKSIDILESITAPESDQGSVMSLFRQGFDTVNGFLDLDELIARGHTAFRDEEYALAIALYQEAAEKIRRHIKTYHLDKELASYEQLFAHNRNGGYINDCEGNNLVADAKAMLGTLEKATVCPSFTRSLINENRNTHTKDASSWWPSEGFFPSEEDMEALWDDKEELLSYILSLGGIGGLMAALIASKTIREEEGLDALQNALSEDNWGIHDVKNGERFSLPFILKENWEKDEATINDLNNTLYEMLVTLAWPKIGGRVGNFAASISADINSLRTCLVGVWGTEKLEFTDVVDIVSRKLPGTNTCIKEFSQELSELFDLELLRDLINDFCIRSETVTIIPASSLTPAIEVDHYYIDSACVVNKIVTHVEDQIEDLSDINFFSLEDILNNLESLSKVMLEKINDLISEWLGDDMSPDKLKTLFDNNKDAIGEYFHKIIQIISDKILVEDKSVWINREGALQEVSNLFNDQDIRNQTELRRGTILFDKEAAGDPKFSSYTADFVLNSGGNDDLGVAFYVSEEDGAVNYYLLALRNGDGEETEHELKKRGMQAAWTLLITAIYGTSVAASQGALAVPGLTAVVPIWIIGLASTEFLWEDIYPKDEAGTFTRLMKVRQSNANATPEIVPLTLVDPDNRFKNFKIEQNKDYSIKVELVKKSGDELQINIELSEIEADRNILASVSAVDNDPLEPGGIGLHSFANNKAVFKKADVTYSPSGFDSLGKLLFVPEKTPENVNSVVYDKRLQITPDKHKRLSEHVGVDIDVFRILINASLCEKKNKDSVEIDTRINDPLDLSPYGIEEGQSLQYRLFDSYVDRNALAELTHRLLEILPHYYFFVLPLSMGDALHAAGDYDRAKQHYDIVYDLFSNEVWRTGDTEEDTPVYADPVSMSGYTYLHPYIEAPLLRTRHASNYLAAGEKVFNNNNPQNRQRAYEQFSKVLLSYGRLKCCENWSGEVTCLPGAPEILEDPYQIEPFEGHLLPGIDLFPWTDSQAEREGQCDDLLKQLEELLEVLPKAERKVIEQELKKANESFLHNGKKNCKELQLLADKYENEIRTLQSQVITQPENEGKKISADVTLSGLVTLYEYLGIKGLKDTSAFISHTSNKNTLTARNDDYAHIDFGELRIAEDADDVPNTYVFVDKVILEDLLDVYKYKPENRLTLLHMERACMYLEMLENGLNILGLRENTSSSYRYEYLMELARTFANFAVNAEKEFISFREKLAHSRLSVMQQEHSLQLLGSHARMQQLTIRQAGIQNDLTKYQLGMVNERDEHLDELLVLNDAEMALAVLSAFMGAGQGSMGVATAGLGVVGTVAGIVAAPPTGGASLVVSLAGLGVAGASLGSAGIGAAGGILGGIQGIFNVYKQGVMLEQQQELLRNYELPMAHLSNRNAQLQKRISQRQFEIGQLEIQFSERVLTYLSHQFMNADIYGFLSKISKKHYQQNISYATSAALMAERALEVEKGQQYNLIKLNYFDVSIQGLMGGETLQQDLNALEYQRFIQDERKIFPPTKMFSLVSAFPLEFESFRHSGRLSFRTTHLDFDRDYPGHYQRQIRSVHVIVLALVGNEGIKATLSQIGSSEIIMKEDSHFVEHLLAGYGQTVPLTVSSDGNTLMPTNPSNSKLNPFEGQGVASTWLFEMLKEANQVDFKSVDDVLFFVEYSAYGDSDYRKVIQENLQAMIWRGTRSLRLRLNYPDAMYQLLNPSIYGSQLTTSVRKNLQTIAITTDLKSFPPNEIGRILEGINFGIFDSEGQTLELSSIYLATRRHIESLWHSGTSHVETKVVPIDIGAEPDITRVLRGGELVKISKSQVKPGELKSTDAWIRVLRNTKLIWIPDGTELTDDILADDIDPSQHPLPDPIPVELLEKCQLPISAFTADDHYTGETKSAFDIRLYDDGTAPRVGKKRILRNNELLWIDKNNDTAGDHIIPDNEWYRVWKDDHFEWKEKLPGETIEGGFYPDDTWYLSFIPEENSNVPRLKIDGYEILDLSNVNDILMLMNYRYKI